MFGVDLILQMYTVRTGLPPVYFFCVVLCIGAHGEMQGPAHCFLGIQGILFESLVPWCSYGFTMEGGGVRGLRFSVRVLQLYPPCSPHTTSQDRFQD